MEQAKDKDEFVRRLAEELMLGEEVRYDPRTLQYGTVYENQYFEYDSFLDEEELPENIDEQLQEWEVELVKDLRAVSELPESMETPWKSIQLEWMVDFANLQGLGDRFIKDVQRGIDGRHPFIEFKDTMRRWGIIDEWYAYRQACYEDYVRHELRHVLG